MKDLEKINRLKQDLHNTVRELSNTYEELALLYRVSEELAGLTVEEICGVILKEVSVVTDVKIAVIFFYDDKSKNFYTKGFKGIWSPEYLTEDLIEILYKGLQSNKPIIFNKNLCMKCSNSRPSFKSALVAPIKGKKSHIGVLFLADKNNTDEFFTGEIKLIQTLLAFVGLFVENALLIEQMQKFLLSAIKALVKALESTSEWTAGHSERVTQYAVAIGKMMGLPLEDIKRLKMCALLHDIGKIAIPKEILNKKGKLETNEWEEIKRHPIIGATILGEMDYFEDVSECVKCHHEHYDGTGILGLKGEKIPLYARIVAVADAFDAITSDRPYRKRFPISEAIKKIINGSGKQFDPTVVDAFLKWAYSTYNIKLSDHKINT